MKTLLFLFLFSMSVFAENVVVTPEPTTELLVNPGKGWCLYYAPENYSPELLACCSLGYTRFVWGNIEPEEGNFRWDIIDKAMEKWTRTGRQFAFGICGASTHSAHFWTSPKWVFDAGAAYDTYELVNPKRPTAGIAGKKLVPIFDDPIYLEKLRAFVKAFAARYDGHPAIAFIDIRSYGNWGEGHMYPFRKHEISPEMYLEHVKIYREAFQKTQLVLPIGGKITRYTPVFEWATAHGITFRRDGICGNSDGAETLVCHGKFPAIFELYGGYDMLKKLGWWDGITDASRCGYKLTDCVETGKATYCNLSQKILDVEPELVRTLGNRLGYHFVFTRMEFPATLVPNQPFPVQTTWENRGVAFLFLPAHVTFALKDAAGNIVKTADAPASLPQKFAPDTPVTVTDTLSFGNVPAGEYTLCVGILPNENGTAFYAKKTPFLRLGVKLPEQNGWYETGKVRVK
ncbi:MAG: DUF4832 domain-containing protein [Planctomycetia bacterium]|nr:DUF4832 domain-containing protein [Planctomycetia bacterium]